nr:RNA-directed DNA polymerase, eukaryota [Tanacetum cinerariifolium]
MQGEFASVSSLSPNPHSSLVVHSHFSQESSLKWVLSTSNVVKLNCDGAFKSNQGAIGIVARDSEGVILACIGERWQASSPLAMELLALTNGWVGAIIESDSSDAIALSSSEFVPPWAVCVIVVDIRAWASRLNLQFSWVRRICNRVAHHVAEDCGSRDLWKVCEGYGKVVDVYIHNRRSKSGRFHLQANVVRYERASKNVKSTCNPASNVKGNKGSYATAVRGTVPLTAPRVPVLSNPAVDFVSEERVVWVDIEGAPLNLWSRETFLKIGSKWGSALDIEDNYGSSFARKVSMVRAKELFTWTLFFLEPQEMIYTSDGDSVQGDKSKSADAQ